jgi:phage terminase large subunit GpA-like protein
VLGHVAFDGNTLDDAVWSKIDHWLKTARWRNERGWRMGIDAIAIDSGGREGRTQKIYNWCHARHSRRIYAVKGVAGPRRLWERAKKVKGAMRLVNVAVDVAKTAVLDMISRDPFPEELRGERDPSAAHFSDSLPEQWFEQVTNERRRLRYRSNRPTFVFELTRPGLPNEALDCFVYGYAVRSALAVRSIDLDERERREPDPQDGAAEARPRRTIGEWAAIFNGP